MRRLSRVTFNWIAAVSLMAFATSLMLRATVGVRVWAVSTGFGTPPMLKSGMLNTRYVLAGQDFRLDSIGGRIIGLFVESRWPRACVVVPVLWAIIYWF